MSGETTPQGQLLIYSDGALNLQVRLDGQTVWLTQAAMAELFQTTPQNITLHLQNIYDEGELIETATCKEYLQVRAEGARQVQRSLRHYNLDAILAVGYRVRSPRGTAFRQWATARLSELLVKGFTLDDERIKAGRTIGADYFDELLAKNYLTQEELESLNLIVSAYLDFAEFQARSHRPMQMADWTAKLDDFIRLSDRDVLAHAGRVSHQQAEEHARDQYEQYERQRRELARADSSDFDEAARRLTEQAFAPKPRRRKKTTEEQRGSDE